MIKTGTKVKVHMYSDPDHKREIKTDNYGEIFTVYKNNGSLGIDWMKNSKSGLRHMYNENGFVPLSEFSTVTVVFEEVESMMKNATNGKRFLLTEFGYRQTPDRVKPERQVNKPVPGFETRVPESWIKKGYVYEN